ncbi:MAG: Iron-sulfur cluster assembly scaffold protein IscU [Chlamydiae bacterium]|nr:Iron-sulfur cluster assembly scaffold protein IscU [Chlamydiota bacterium]
MGFDALTTSFAWSRYSKKLTAKIERPHNVGSFQADQSEERGMRMVVGTEGTLKEGNVVSLYWLVDKEDGVVVDAMFQAFGQSALIGAAEVTCDLLIGKNYDQASRINADLIDKQVRDRSDEPAFPPDTIPHLHLVLSAIENAAEQCTDIPLAESYAAPPAPADIGEVVEGGYPGWEKLTKKKKIAVIEEVLNNDIRPYVALDGGGVEVLDLVNDQEIKIAYQGNCTSCYSAVGATLSYIQQVIRAKVHPDLTVVPDL